MLADRKWQKKEVTKLKQGALMREKKIASGEARTSYIFIKHEVSRCKFPWKDPDGRVICATTRDTAVARLSTFRDILTGKVHFEVVATHHSGGDLGSF